MNSTSRRSEGEHNTTDYNKPSRQIDDKRHQASGKGYHPRNLVAQQEAQEVPVDVLLIFLSLVDLPHSRHSPLTAGVVG